MRRIDPSKRRIKPSKRRLAAVIAGFLVVAGTGIALWALDGAGAMPPESETAHETLVRLDDLAAAAEAHVTLATLRSTVGADATPDRSGRHVRLLANQLANSFHAARRARSDELASIGSGIDEVRSLLQTTDPAVGAAIDELAASLRALTR